MAPGLSYLCLSQDGKTSRRELLDRFQADGRAVLFATRSFWEGVDVPGDALSLVILDKIPFLPQDDPVLKRQEKLIADRQGNPFNELQLSHAILTLRQGAAGSYAPRMIGASSHCWIRVSWRSLRSEDSRCATGRSPDQAI